MLTIDWATGSTDIPVEITAVPPTNHIYVDEGKSFEIVFGVYGYDPHLLWFKDSVALPGETAATFSRTAAVLGDSGNYYLQVTNSVPSSTNSPVIQVTVVPDTKPPYLMSALAYGRTTLTNLTLTFDEPLSPTGASTPGNYTITPLVSIGGATLVNSTSVVLTINATFGQRYTVTVGNNIHDVAGNASAPPNNSLEMTTALLLADWADTWKYDASDTDLISPVPPFSDRTYDDSLWLSGAGLLGLEDNYTGPDVLPAAINTPVTANHFTSYYRKTDVNWPYAPGAVDSHVELAIIHFVDDGVVFHVNGAEAFRFKMPAEPAVIAHSTFADETGFTGEAVLATNIVNLSLLQQGNNTIAADLHAINDTSSDCLFGARILAVLPPVEPVAITSVPPTNHIVVTQGYAFSISFGVSGFEPQYQWFHDTVGIAGANADTYSVANAAVADGGEYYLQVTNSLGSSTNSPVITVEVIADNTAPTILSAVRQLDLTNVVVTFSESMGAQQASNAVNYVLNPANAVVAVTLSANDTVATVQTANPIADSSVQTTMLTINNVADPAGNALSPNSITILTPTGFQQGVNGYAGTVDTYVSATDPDTAFGANAVVLVDGESPISHGLLRFDNIFGGNPGQIEAGATINSATLRLRNENNGDDVSIYDMARAWTPNDTWNTLGADGITNDIVEPAIATISPTAATVGMFIDIDVTVAVQSWANGGVNYGWGMINLGTDGFQFDSSEGATVSYRPQLIVDWTGGRRPSPSPSSSSRWLRKPLKKAIRSLSRSWSSAPIRNTNGRRAAWISRERLGAPIPSPMPCRVMPEFTDALFTTPRTRLPLRTRF